MVALENFDKIFSDNELINLYKATKDKYYIEELYNRYERLLNKIAFKYSHINSLYSYEDLKSESYIALEKAARAYKPDISQFSTFLFTSVNNYLYQVVNGVTSKDKANKILNDCISIYTVISDKDDQCMLIDTIEDITAEESFNLPEIMFIADLRAAEEEAISKLTPKQRLVVEAVNGFNSEIYKEVELATLLEVTPGNIWDIKNNAYRKLRHDKRLREIFFEEFRS